MDSIIPFTETKATIPKLMEMGLYIVKAKEREERVLERTWISLVSNVLTSVFKMEQKVNIRKVNLVSFLCYYESLYDLYLGR